METAATADFLLTASEQITGQLIRGLDLFSLIMRTDIVP
jgi:hypothetical protein